ncbi:MAG: hypothetical protein GX081_02620 [Firmicutes bacterium]|nr:hypothetical protein [Bacillota bacterium]
MKRALLMGILFLCLMLLCFLGQGVAKAQVWPANEIYLWRMEDKRELRSFDSDRSGARFVLDDEYVTEGNYSCKVIPGGGEETKLAVKITGLIEKWNGKNSLFLDLYLPEDHPLNGCFLGLAQALPEWEWIDGCMAATSVIPGEWNRVIFKLTDKMKFLHPRKQYIIYLCFWHDDGGEKIPLHKENPFYIDGIGLIE